MFMYYSNHLPVGISSRLPKGLWQLQASADGHALARALADSKVVTIGCILVS